MSKEYVSITYENNIFYCTKNKTKWISVDGKKWYGEEKQIRDLERENRLLGERCNQLLKDKGNLTDELKNWKEEWQEQVQKAIDEGYARTLQTIQLTKAKKQIEKAVEIIRELGSTVQEGVTCHYLVDNGALHKATLFLKEIKE